MFLFWGNYYYLIAIRIFLLKIHPAFENDKWLIRSLLVRNKVTHLRPDDTVTDTQCLESQVWQLKWQTSCGVSLCVQVSVYVCESVYERVCIIQRPVHHSLTNQCTVLNTLYYSQLHKIYTHTQHHCYQA